MKIELYHHEVLDALSEYINRTYGLECDLAEDLDSSPEIEYQVPVRPFKKHKNGRVVKNSDGYPVIDHANTTYKTDWITWNETGSMHFYLAPSTV